VLLASFPKASAIWIASSRVGLRTRARIGSEVFLSTSDDADFKRESTIGRRKASVFPVPVCAVATTSTPVRAAGIAFAWTGVGWVNELRARF